MAPGEPAGAGEGGNMENMADKLRSLLAAAERVPLVEIHEGKYAGTWDYAREDTTFIEAAQTFVAAVEAAAAKFCADVGHLDVVKDAFDLSYAEDGSWIEAQRYCECCNRIVSQR
jgi:hypothetical protein